MAKVNFNQLAANTVEHAIDINWELRIPRVIGSTDRDLAGTTGYININCTSANLPKEDVKFDEVSIKGVKTRQVVNVDRSGDITLECLESDAFTLQTWFEDLVSNHYVHPENRTISAKSEYQIDSGIQLVLTDGKGDAKKAYSLRYCTFEAPEFQELSTGDGAIAKCKFNIHYLNWEFTDANQ